jgi:hypothetical protein
MLGHTLSPDTLATGFLEEDSCERRRVGPRLLFRSGSYPRQEREYIHSMFTGHVTAVGFGFDAVSGPIVNEVRYPIGIATKLVGSRITK